MGDSRLASSFIMLNLSFFLVPVAGGPRISYSSRLYHIGGRAAYKERKLLAFLRKLFLDMDVLHKKHPGRLTIQTTGMGTTIFISNQPFRLWMVMVPPYLSAV